MGKPLVLDDSHLMVVDHVSRCDLSIKQIVHFDAHSDLSLLKDKANDGNVLTWWLTRHEVDEIFWVLPTRLVERIHSSGLAVIYSFVPTAVSDSLQPANTIGIATLQLPSNTKLTLIEASDLPHIPTTPELWLDFDLDFLSFEPEPQQWFSTYQAEIKRIASRAEIVSLALSFAFGTTRHQDLTWTIPLWQSCNRSSAYVPSLTRTFSLQDESQACLQALTQHLVSDVDRQLRVLFYHGQLHEFMTKVEKAIQLHYPLQRETTYLLPMAYLLTGQYSQAIAQFDQEYTENNNLYAQYAKNIVQKVQNNLT